jgi:tripeptidyl-peptidase-1
MTAEEIIEFFAPHANASNRVTEWLVESGIAPDRLGISVNKQVTILLRLL